MARMDRVLKSLCLFKTRSQATAACREGRVLLDGAPVRASHEVREGQQIVLRDRMGLTETRVVLLAVPERQVPKKEVSSFATVTVHRRAPAGDEDEGSHDG